MDSDTFPISDFAAEVQEDTTDVNSNPAVEEVIAQTPVIIQPAVPTLSSAVVQSSFGRASENHPMVVTVIQTN